MELESSNKKLENNVAHETAPVRDMPKIPLKFLSPDINNLTTEQLKSLEASMDSWFNTQRNTLSREEEEVFRKARRSAVMLAIYKEKIAPKLNVSLGAYSVKELKSYKLSLEAEIHGLNMEYMPSLAREKIDSKLSEINILGKILSAQEKTGVVNSPEPELEETTPVAQNSWWNKIKGRLSKHPSGTKDREGALSVVEKESVVIDPDEKELVNYIESMKQEFASRREAYQSKIKNNEDLQELIPAIENTKIRIPRRKFIEQAVSATAGTILSSKDPNHTQDHKKDGAMKEIE